MIVGGTFDKEGGKQSSIVAQMAKFLGVDSVNGGTLESLDIDFSGVDALIWMPNIHNDEDKILPGIKVKYPHMLLVQSKLITDGNYTPADVVGRLLKSRALLGITFESNSKGNYKFELLDPLGNIYCKTRKIEKLCRELRKRITHIQSMSRVPSVTAGPIRYVNIEKEFIDIVKQFGEKFSTFVNAVNPNRLLGNAATRCESGFPAIKSDGKVFVSRRNVDKKTLASKDFVEVRIGDRRVEYFGTKKPSVDTPMQAFLFEYFPEVKYMIHGHVYVENAPMTENKIPCGFLEEIEEILDVVKGNNLREFSVNLKGHGCLIACSDLSYFDTVKLVGRPLPESEGMVKVLDIFDIEQPDNSPWCVSYELVTGGTWYKYFKSLTEANEWAMSHGYND